MNVAAVVLVVLGLAVATPRLHVVSTSPLVVRGNGFHASERVRIEVTGSVRATRTVTATPDGTFGARFPTLTIGHCSAYAGRAFGSEGSRAVLRVQPECPAPLTP
jgi:hypothetical protein